MPDKAGRKSGTHNPGAGRYSTVIPAKAGTQLAERGASGFTYILLIVLRVLSQDIQGPACEAGTQLSLG
jgi:hypothetical protein